MMDRGLRVSSLEVVEQGSSVRASPLARKGQCVDGITHRVLQIPRSIDLSSQKRVAVAYRQYPSPQGFR